MDNLSQLTGTVLSKCPAYVDSGAVESVVPMHELPEFEVVSSVGSRRGHQYVTANRARICNEGE